MLELVLDMVSNEHRGRELRRRRRRSKGLDFLRERGGIHEVVAREVPEER